MGIWHAMGVISDYQKDRVRVQTRKFLRKLQSRRSYSLVNRRGVGIPRRRRRILWGAHTSSQARKSSGHRADFCLLLMFLFFLSPRAHTQVPGRCCGDSQNDPQKIFEQAPEQNPAAEAVNQHCSLDGAGVCRIYLYISLIYLCISLSLIYISNLHISLSNIYISL